MAVENWAWRDFIGKCLGQRGFGNEPGDRSRSQSKVKKGGEVCWEGKSHVWVMDDGRKMV